MKKFALVLIASALFFSCRKNDASSTEQNEVLSKRECATDVAVQSIISTDPGVKQRMDQVELFTRRVIANNKVGRLSAGTITIPVVVHVLYNKAEENISAAQIQSQIDVLNEDFNLRNADRSQVPGIFSGAVADVGVKFVLAQVIRKATNKKTWPANDGMKFSQQGGSDAVDPANNLNIWVSTWPSILAMLTIQALSRRVMAWFACTVHLAERVRCWSLTIKEEPQRMKWATTSTSGIFGAMPLAALTWLMIRRNTIHLISVVHRSRITAPAQAILLK